MEVGNAILVLDDDLAIDQGCLAGKLGRSFDYPAIRTGPVPPMPGKGPDFAAVNDDQGAVAVMLDLVNPALAGGRFRYQRGDFWLDEAERNRN
jgi:hypothetical protein